jgi:hypothetical protein
MDILTLLIVILVLLWFFGYIGPRSFYVRNPTPVWAGDWLNILLALVLIIILLRVLRLA